MTDLTPAQIHCVDQFTAAVNHALTQAAQALAAVHPTDHQIMQLAQDIAGMCATDPECMQRIAVGYTYALHRLGRQ